MQIIGVDLHTRQQTVAMLSVETGEIVEKTYVLVAASTRLKPDAKLSPAFLRLCPGRNA